jgi:hypothetical protein
MSPKKTESTMKDTNKLIIKGTIDKILEENKNIGLTMPTFLQKLTDSNISFTADGFRDSGFGIRYRINGETERASKIGDEFTAVGLQKRGVEYDKNRDRAAITEFAQDSMANGVGDRLGAILVDQETVADTIVNVEEPDQQIISDGYVDQVYTDFVAVVAEEEPDYVDQVFSDFTSALGLEEIVQGQKEEEEEEPVSQDVQEEQAAIEEDKESEPVVINKEEEELISQDVQEEPTIIEEDKEPEPVATNGEEEELLRNEWDNGQEEEQKLVISQGEEIEQPNEIVTEKTEATLQEKNPATVEQSAIDTINFMLDLLQSDKFHPTSKIAEADRYSFSRNEEGGVQINDTYNKDRVVFQTDKDNNVKVSDFQPDEKAKFTALFTKLQKDENKLRSIRPNSRSGDKLRLSSQDVLKSEQSVAAEILQVPAKDALRAIYEPIYPTAGQIQDWTKDAYLTIEDPQERQETVSMLGGYLDKVNNPERYPLSEKDFQKVSTLERNSYDLRSTRDGVVTRDQAINDNPQVKAELGLVSQPKPQIQKPIPVQSQR